MPEPIKAITVHQPWATLLALGEKEYETRSWATGYRGPIAIHAGKTQEHVEHFAAWVRRWKGLECIYPAPLTFHAYTHQAICRSSDKRIIKDIFPFGAIVAVGELRAMHMRYPPDLSEQEAAFGFFGEGRVAWQIANVRRLETPIPARGQQGLWQWTPPDGFVMP